MTTALLLALFACKDDGAPDDTGEDTDVPPPPAEDWDDCPTIDAFTTDATTTTPLGLDAALVLCSLPSENRPLAQEATNKALLHLPPGTYTIPDDASEGALTWPVCVRTASGSNPAVDGAGTYTATRWSDFGFTDARLDTLQRLTTGADLRGTVWRSVEGETLPEPSFIGNAQGTAGGAFRLTAAGTEEWDPANVDFAPCGGTGWSVENLNVTFDGGALALRLHVERNSGAIGAGTERSWFSDASGDFQSSNLTITRFWDLIYRPDHHHFGREFLVRFEAPIADACGLRVYTTDVFEPENTTKVWTVDCALNDLAELAVTAASLER